MNEKIARMWQLQEIDLLINDAEKRLNGLPELHEYRARRKVEAVAQQSIGEMSAGLQELRRQSRRLELDLQKTSAELDSLRDKLYGGKIKDIKELSNIEKKMQYTEKEKSALEDRLLEIIGALEEKEAEVSKIELKLEADRKQTRALAAVVRKKAEAIKNEQADLQAKKEQIAATLDSASLQRYQSLSCSFNGRGIAIIEQGMCNGCRVFVSSYVKQQFNDPHQDVRCENCGRLLYDPAP